jgi:PAS domain S-box-containing protein
VPLHEDKGVVVPFLSQSLSSRQRTRASGASEPALNVLVIDDTPKDRMTVRLALEAGGFVLQEAADAKQGLKLAESSTLDCILLDYVLPDAEGLDVLESLRQLGGTLPCAVIMLMGGETADVATAAMKAGALDYLVKDRLDAEMLRRAIGSAVRQFRLIEAISERQRAEDALRRHAERQALLLKVTSDIIRASEPGELGRVMFEHVSSALGAVVCTNYRLDPTEQRLRLVFVHGIPPEYLEAARSLELAQEYCGTAAAICRPLVADRRGIASDPNAALVRKLGATAYASHPLKASDGRLLGTFAVASATRESFTDDEVVWLGTISNFLAQAWERFEVEQGLRASEERLRLSQEAAGLGHWDFDFARGTLVWSEQTRKLLGLKPGTPASRALLLSRVHAEDRPRLDEHIARSARPDSDHGRHLEFRIVMQNGAVRWLEDQSRVETNAAGVPVRAVGVVRDITARKNAEDAQARLAEREVQLALFVEHAPAAIAMFDDEMRYLAASRRYVSDFRLPPDVELVGRSHYEIFPDIPARWREIHARVLAGEELAHEEDPFPRLDGRTDWCRWLMKPWHTADGRIGGALLFSEVITEQLRARRALADSEARFRATFENAAVGIAHFDPDFRWLRANEALCRILGYRADELVTKSLEEINHPDDLRTCLGHVERMRDRQIDSFGMDKRYRRKDGSLVWIRLTNGCARKSDGSIDYFVCMFEDISARKHAEEELRKSEERFRSSLLHAPLPILLFDDREQILATSQSWLEGSGYSRDELLRIEDWTTRACGERADEALGQIRQIISTEPEAWPAEATIRTKDGRERIWSFVSSALGTQSDGRRLFVCIAQDVTNRKAHEEHVHLLMREVNHRAKNMLSLVQAIARQTAARAPEDFIGRFTERIQALAANQDLLVRNEWQGVDVEDLVRAQLAHFADLIGRRIAVRGPKQLRLNAAAAQAIGLALHELATNAGKYGALSVDAGRVEVGWAVDRDIFAMSWTERGGPSVSPPERRGFGSTVIASMAKLSVGGEVELDYAPSGLTWRLICPATNALEGREPWISANREEMSTRLERAN